VTDRPRVLDGAEAEAFRLESEGLDPKAIGRRVNRQVRGIRALLADPDARDAWNLMQRLGTVPTPPLASPARDARACTPAPARATVEVVDVGPEGEALRGFLAELRGCGVWQIAAEACGLSTEDVVEMLESSRSWPAARKARAEVPLRMLAALHAAVEGGDESAARTTVLALKAVRPDVFDRRAVGPDGDPADKAGGIDGDSPAVAMLGVIVGCGPDACADADLMVVPG